MANTNNNNNNINGIHIDIKVSAQNEEKITDPTIITKLKKEIENIKASLMISNPFLSAIIRNCNIRYVNIPNAFAGVDKRLNLYIGEEFLKMLPRQKTFTLCHEAMHIAFMHPKRAGNRKRGIWNIANDIVINETLYTILSNQDLKIWNANLAEEEFAITIDRNNLLSETIYDQIINSGRANHYNNYTLSDDLFPDEEDVYSDSVEIQSGNPEQYKDPDKFWKDVVSGAYIQQKIIGKQIPEGIDRLVKELLSPKINWALKLASDMKVAFSNNAISSWKKIRRFDFSPTLEYLGTKNIYILLDTSGSISENTLKQSLSEISKIISTSHKVTLISFDAEAYETAKFKTVDSFTQFVFNKGVKGGGSTYIEKALKLLETKLRYGDAVVIFTDGEIFDLNSPEVKRLFNAIANKTSYRAIVTFGVDVDIPRYQLIRYNNGNCHT